MAASVRKIQSVEVGGRVLDALVQSVSAMSLKEIGNAANCAPTQLHAYLASFREAGIVEQDPVSGRYYLGPFAMRLGLSRLKSLPVYALASETLATLARELGVLALMVAWTRHGPTVVEARQGASPLNVNVREGTVFSVTGTASGRIFAAFHQNAAALAVRAGLELREQHTRARTSIVRRQREFEVIVAAVRRERYCELGGTPIPDVNVIAAPVLDSRGEFHLAISIVGKTELLELSPGGRIKRRFLRLMDGPFE